MAFVAVLGVLFVHLGQWQLDRLDQRRARNTATVTNEGRPVEPLAAVFTRPITDADQWQRVEAVGTFGEEQFLVRYRRNNGEKGYEVVTPLRTATGVVLVDRGFVLTPQGTRIPSAAPPPPSGEVRIVGHVRRNEEGRRVAITPADGQMRLINSEAISAALGYPVLNGYVGLLEISPAQSGGFEPVALPTIDEGPHFWYAVQWFGFTGVAVVGIVVFIRADLRTRREDEEAAARHTASVG